MSHFAHYFHLFICSAFYEEIESKQSLDKSNANQIAGGSFIFPFFISAKSLCFTLFPFYHHESWPFQSFLQFTLCSLHHNSYFSYQSFPNSFRKKTRFFKLFIFISISVTNSKTTKKNCQRKLSQAIVFNRAAFCNFFMWTESKANG